MATLFYFFCGLIGIYYGMDKVSCNCNYGGV